MTTMYIFFLAFGAPLLLWMVFAGDGDSDGVGPLAIVPLSTIAFVMTFFGLAGLAIGAGGAGVGLTLTLAIAAGALAGGINSAAFAWLRRNSASSDVTDRELEGTIARVTMQVGSLRRGKIVLNIAGAREQMTAAPVDDSLIAAGERVVVVRVDKGVALVAPFEKDLELE